MEREVTRGFTLVEMLIVAGIFSTAMLILSNLYLTITKTQRRVASAQRVIEDARFIVEAMGQQIRLSTLDYDWYDQLDIDLYPTAANKPYTLALRTQTNEQLFFRRSSLEADANDGLGSQLETCTVTASTACALTDDWIDVTPAGVSVTYLTFQIWPSADPFVEPTNIPASCTDDAVCTVFNASYRCVASKCAYATDGRDFQPKVRITMRSQGSSAQIAERSSVNIQTLVTTRSPKGRVENLHYGP